MIARSRWPLLLAAAIVAACAEDPVSPDPDGVTPPPEELPPSVPRVLVVNGLSETLSSLDPSTGTMTVQAAVLGSCPNRVNATPDRLRLLVTSSGDNEVEIRAAHDLSRRSGIDVGRGSNPWSALPLSNDEAIVTSWLSSDVRRLNLETGAAGPPLPTTLGPEGVAVDGGYAWIACTNYQSDGEYGPGRLDVVDLAAWRVVASIPVGRNPQDVLVDEAGRVHVLCTGTYGTGPDDEAGSVHVIDRGSLSVTGRLDLGGSPGRFALAEDGVVWVAGFSGGVRRYVASSLEALADPTDPALGSDGLSGIAVDSVTGTVWVTRFDADLLLAIDAGSVSLQNAWLVGDGPVDVLVLRPDQRGVP